MGGFGFGVFRQRLRVAAPAPVLGSLALANPFITENTLGATAVSAISGFTTGSILTLTDTSGGRFALTGTNLVAGTTATDYETATSHAITLREALAGASNTPRDTVLTVTVINQFEAPLLAALALASASFILGSAASGIVTGATAGSAIVASGLPAGLTVNGSARTWTWTGAGSVGSATITLTETLADSANSPRATDLGVTIALADGALDFAYPTQSGLLALLLETL